MENNSKVIRLNEIDLINNDNTLSNYDKLIQKKVIYAIAMVEICRQFHVRFSEIDNKNENWFLISFENEAFLKIWQKKCKDFK